MEVTLSDLPVLALFERIRRGLLLSFGALLVFSLGAWFFTEPVIVFLSEMYQGVEDLVYTHIAESFFVRLKLAIAMGFSLSVPWLLWQLSRIVAPIVRPSDRRISLSLIPFASMLYFGGMAFALFAVLPMAIRFFLGFGGDGVEALIRLDSMVGFTISFVIPFAIIFQLPVIVYFLARIGLLKAAALRRYWKYSMLGILVISAILTPADVFSQIMMSIPLLLLYEVSIVLARIANRAGERTARGQ